MAKRLVNFRADTELLDRVTAKAKAFGETLTDVIIRALEEYAEASSSKILRGKRGTARKDVGPGTRCPHPPARRQKGLCMACGTAVP